MKKKDKMETTTSSTLDKEEKIELIKRLKDLNLKPKNTYTQRSVAQCYTQQLNKKGEYYGKR